MTKIIAFLAVVVFAGAVGVAYMQSTKAIKNAAVLGCLTVGKETFIYEKSQAVVPSEKTYKDCMTKMGY